MNMLILLHVIFYFLYILKLLLMLIISVYQLQVVWQEVVLGNSLVLEASVVFNKT